MTNNCWSSIFRVFAILVVSYTIVVAQSWQKIPTDPPGKNEPNLRGVVIAGQMLNTAKPLETSVVISGANRAGIYTLGIWIHELSSLMPEKSLWPYMGPDPGKEAFNHKMIEICLSKGGIQQKWNFPMGVISGGNFPKGAWSKKDLFLSTGIKGNSKEGSLLKKMSSGFDFATITIGRGVFVSPIEVRFQCGNFEDLFKDVREFVDPGSFKAQ